LANFHKSEWDRIISNADVDRQLNGTIGLPTARIQNWSGGSNPRRRSGMESTI
jgi:hypothetical protein